MVRCPSFPEAPPPRLTYDLEQRRLERLLKRLARVGSAGDHLNVRALRRKELLPQDRERLDMMNCDRLCGRYTSRRGRCTSEPSVSKP